MNTVLITGGAGFIGSHLIDRLLLEGNRVICLDNFDSFYPEKIKCQNLEKACKSELFTLVRGDVRDEEILNKIFVSHVIDFVVHLAGKAGVRPSILNPYEYFDVNVSGTIKLANCMKKHGVKKLIFASSSSVYGNNTKVPFSEKDSVDYPISPYAASKKAAELFLYTFHHLCQIDVVCLRFFTVYGPRQRPDLAIHKFFNCLYSNQLIELYGDGSTGRDYTYITDTLDGIISAIKFIQSKTNIYEIINLGNNSPVKLNELVLNIEKVTGKKFTTSHLPMQPGDVDLTFADIEKAKKLLNYQPKTTFKNGLIHFNEWFKLAVLDGKI